MQYDSRCPAKRRHIPSTVVSLNRPAQSYYNKDDYSRAQALHEECLAPEYEKFQMRDV